MAGGWAKFGKSILSIPKKTLAGAAIAGGLVALPFVVSDIRGKREKNSVVPLPPEPEPQVLVDPSTQMGMPGQTLMGQQMVTDGPMAQRVMAQRGQMVPGMDPTAAPSLIGADGNSVIDGRPVQSMGR